MGTVYKWTNVSKISVFRIDITQPHTSPLKSKIVGLQVGGTLEFQIEDTAQKNLTRLKKSIIIIFI